MGFMFLNNYCSWVVHEPSEIFFYGFLWTIRLDGYLITSKTSIFHLLTPLGQFLHDWDPRFSLIHTTAGFTGCYDESM